MTPTQPPDGAGKWAPSSRAIAIWNRASTAYNRKDTDKLWAESAALEIDEALREIDEEHARRRAINAAHAASERDKTVRLLEEASTKLDERYLDALDNNLSSRINQHLTRLKEQTR